MRREAADLQQRAVYITGSPHGVAHNNRSTSSPRVWKQPPGTDLVIYRLRLEWLDYLPSFRIFIFPPFFCH